MKGLNTWNQKRAEMTSFTESWEGGGYRHIQLVEYLQEFLLPLGFYMKSGGYGDYTYTDQDYPGGYSRDYDSWISYEDYESCGYPDRMWGVSSVNFVNPPNRVDVEFDYSMCDGELTACLNTSIIPTSKHRTGKVHWNEWVGKFDKSWRNREQFEEEFESWFRSEGLRLLNVERSEND
jgi:hypothetical protein